MNDQKKIVIKAEKILLISSPSRCKTSYR
uniref:Uncharacterized protein n=1 Tax=Arundo donax TaxID=35708 RepID=A0A0A9AWK9_ARUDO